MKKIRVFTGNKSFVVEENIDAYMEEHKLFIVDQSCAVTALTDGRVMIVVTVTFDDGGV